MDLMYRELIEIDDLEFEYLQDEEQEPIKALKGISLKIEKGSFTAVLGKNGSGKSTLAKNLNGLILPSKGAVYIKGMNTLEEDKIWDIRQTSGMVFQNPDNQLVSSIVEDDVAFGPENMGLPREVIRERVDFALKSVGMYDFRKKSPHHLSGGQKQRIAIAGVIAMEPECIIFDEPTAMLDPKGRDDIMRIMKELNQKGITIVLITHFMEEAVLADRIVIVNDGQIFLDGTPKQIFKEHKKIKEVNLDVPKVVELGDRLRKRGIDVPFDIITKEEMVEFICQYK